MKIDIYENNFALRLLWNSYRAWIELEISVYSLSNFGVASNLIGSLSRSIIHSLRRKHKEGHKKCCWDHWVSITKTIILFNLGE